LLRAISAVGILRAQEEAQTAAVLAKRATIRPEGFAVLSPGPIAAAALGRLVQAISGAAYPPSLSQLADLAMRPRAATVAGARLVDYGSNILIVREEAAISGGAMRMYSGARWDNRFTCHGVLPGAVIGKLGDEAAAVRGISRLPSVVLRTLPAVRVGEKLAMVPHIGYKAAKIVAHAAMIFTPPGPVAGANFQPAV
jgi:tRNA(Ile)-lysidine synthase